MLHPPKDEITKIFNRNLGILVDIPDYKKVLVDRPLICVPELQSKTYYPESPSEALNLNDALESLMKLISPIRILCHADLRQWIGVYIKPEQMRTIIDIALEKVKS